VFLGEAPSDLVTLGWSVADPAGALQPWLDTFWRIVYTQPVATAELLQLRNDLGSAH